MFGPYSATDPWIITNSANHAYWAAQSLDPGTTIEDAPDPGPTATRAVMVFSRATPTNLPEDVATCGFWWCQAAAGNATKLSSTDRAVVKTAMGTFWTALRTLTPATHTLREIRWYDYEPLDGRPGPAVEVQTIGTAGTSGSGPVAYSSAATVTAQTAGRAHWGRSYLPSVDAGSYDTTYGRLTGGRVTALANAYRALLQVSGGSGTINPCVVSTGHQAILGIKSMQVDDVPDVQRRRRHKRKSNFTVFTS